MSWDAALAARNVIPCTCDGLLPHDMSCDRSISDDGLRAFLEAAIPHVLAEDQAKPDTCE